MLDRAERMLELSGQDAGALPAALLSGRTPAVLRGLVSDWPVVQAGKESNANLVSYLKGYCGNSTVGAWLGGPEIGGRFFYNQDFSGFNFRAMRIVFSASGNFPSHFCNIARLYSVLGFCGSSTAASSITRTDA